MGEAKRRGDFESRKRQSIHAEEARQAEQEIIRRDREQAMALNQTVGTRSKHSMSLAIAAMMAASAARKLEWL